MAVSFGLNDFFHTTDWDTGKHNDCHQRDLTWLNEEVTRLEKEDPDARIVIFTHWSPTKDARSIGPKHATSPITSAFTTNLSGQPCFKSGAVKLWAFGHTHYNCDFTVEREGNAGKLRLLTNQRGFYFAQAGDVVEGKVVEVEYL
jgi:hypothetical protein